MIATNVLSIPQLTDINEVVEFSDADKPLFDELYDVLKKYDSLHRFGISLLHSHFDLAENEVLIERTDRASRQQIIEPITLDELSEISVIETSWRLDAKGRPHAEGRCQKENTSIPPQHVDRFR